jgi:oligopeptide/dipeptide ABC transporter ATP-binding protein
MMTLTAPVIEISELVIEFATRGLPVRALDCVDFKAWRDECVGIVGESGSGKSTLAMAIGGLNRAGVKPLQGRVSMAGRDVFSIDGVERRRFLSEDIGFVFQNPIGSLDPTRRIFKQFFSQAGRLLERERIEGLLQSVGLHDTDRILSSYPHELSGGMAQRVCIAMAISANPSLLIADEPTAALDASTRLQVLDVLTTLRAQTRATMVLVSHDLHVIRRYCDRICVMYAGRIVESGPTGAVLDNPQHPYTAALLRSTPGPEGKAGRLISIPGSPPTLHGKAEYCAFEPRCTSAMQRCTNQRPETVLLEGRSTSCWLPLAGSKK